MTPEDYGTISDKDHTVLYHIRNGKDDTQKITGSTVLDKDQVNHIFDKLEKHGLITTETPDGYVERVVDGQKRVFRAPRQAELTEKGEEYFEWVGRETEIDRYEDMNREELARRVYELETALEDLEQRFDVFQHQVKRRLKD